MAATLKRDPQIAQAREELDAAWPGQFMSEWTYAGLWVRTPWKRGTGTVTVLLKMQDERLTVSDDGWTAMRLSATDPNGDYVHFGSRRHAAASVCEAVGCDLGQSDISCCVGDGVSVGEAVMRVSQASVQLLALDPLAASAAPTDAA